MIRVTIEVNVEGMEEGTHILAKDLKLPEGVRLGVDPEEEVAVIAGVREEEPEEEDEDDDVGISPLGEA